jgi:hypothetical protein
MSSAKNWIAVASANHVQRGREGGFMQVCHGKAAPLRRIRTGDRVIYYSPTLEFGGKIKCQQFTAIGIAKDNEPYQFDMGGGFCPFRRDVDWFSAQATAIQPLLTELDFSSGMTNWGYQFRFGLFAISEHDVEIIATSMGVNINQNPGI